MAFISLLVPRARDARRYDICVAISQTIASSNAPACWELDPFGLHASPDTGGKATKKGFHFAIQQEARLDGVSKDLPREASFLVS